MTTHGKFNKRNPIRILFDKISSGLTNQTATIGLLVMLGALILAVFAVVRFGDRLTELGAIGEANDHSLATTPEPTIASCPTATPIVAPSITPGRGLYVLIDRSYSYSLFTQWALDTIKNVLRTTISADDRLTASWIGRNSADPNNTFCCDRPVPQVVIPILLPVPDEPVVEPTIPPSKESSSVEEVQRKLQNDSIITENDRKTQAYYCNLAIRNEDALLKLQRWEDDQTSAIDEFWLAVEPKFSVGQFDPVTNVHEAIYRAATVIHNEEKQKSLFLIIFSDMTETDAPTFSDVHPDLSDITVIIVLHCTQAAACESHKTYWTNEFARMGAKTPIYLQEAYPEEELIGLLTRR
jgi:hypothetical protein